MSVATSTENLQKAPRMRLHFNVHEPVELVEMTLAFQGLGYEYQSFLKEESGLHAAKKSSNTNDVKLYITKIESNCILAELAPALPTLGALAPIVSDVNAVADFIRNTANTINWLIGIAEKENLVQDEIKHSKKKINNIKDIVALVGKNKDANLGLKAINYEEESGEDKVVLEIDFSDDDCKKAEYGARRALNALDMNEKADKEKVLMYFYQTNIDDPKSNGRTGDKAYINSVSKDPLSVFILSEMDQQKIRYVLDDKEHNPLHTGFVVDVNIENDRKGRPKIYRVLKVHDVIYDDD